MKGWIKKTDILQYSRRPHRIQHRLIDYNIYIPCHFEPETIVNHMVMCVIKGKFGFLHQVTLPTRAITMDTKVIRTKYGSTSYLQWCAIEAILKAKDETNMEKQEYEIQLKEVKLPMGTVGWTGSLNVFESDIKLVNKGSGGRETLERAEERETGGADPVKPKYGTVTG